jgi:ankyrin repeat protein
VELFLHAGANPNFFSESGEHVLHTAVHHDAEEDILELLIAAGADVNAKVFIM